MQLHQGWPPLPPPVSTSPGRFWLYGKPSTATLSELTCPGCHRPSKVRWLAAKPEVCPPSTANGCHLGNSLQYQFAHLKQNAVRLRHDPIQDTFTKPRHSGFVTLSTSHISRHSEIPSTRSLRKAPSVPQLCTIL